MRIEREFSLIAPLVHPCAFSIVQVDLLKNKCQKSLIKGFIVVIITITGLMNLSPYITGYTRLYSKKGFLGVSLKHGEAASN